VATRLRLLAPLACATLACFLLVGAVSGAAPSSSLQSPNSVLVYSLTGDITGVTAQAVQNLLATAESANARLVVIQLSTPGGEIGAVESIMQMLAASSVPVLIYVPTAAMAVGGGTYMLMASHIAGMGPGAQIGVCQPVVGAIPTYDPSYVDFVVTLMTDHARLHERNETTAARFILDNLALGSTDAKNLGAIEFASDSLPALLTSLEGYTLIRRAPEATFRLVPTTDLDTYNWTAQWDFAGIASAPQIEYLPPVALTLLAFLANPVINFVFLQVGIWGFVFAFHAPGHYGEVLSIVCIILALVGMGIIGISIGGIVLFVLGIFLLLIEAKTEMSFSGASGVAGAVCFAIGGIFFLPPTQWLIPQSSMWVFQGVAVAIAGMFAGLFGYIVMKAAQARHLTSEFAPERFVGKQGFAETILDPEGRVRALGESWSATAVDPPIKIGEAVEVIRLDGIHLVVRRLENQSEGQ
jgi:membrane-bound serine protease (ClpP class)